MNFYLLCIHNSFLLQLWCFIKSIKSAIVKEHIRNVQDHITFEWLA